ncbi:hypothetical protein HPB48_027046 [Haemaphysalis longicornis]|uniref:Serpin domain-containing protein n=1 Tax=Haemaphysalis longicornis TaxID=44386 RepID=A0A9J6HCZ6_HAELO|nr:hypothetical protein HPB48_027046 [Haemaphysalis longicornis]
MMYQKNDYRMGRCGDLGVTALEIPYRGGKTSMVVLLPDELEGLSNVERHLTSAKLGNLLKDLHMTSDVMLYLPKFKLEQTIDLNDTLKELGIRDFFSSSADLNGISAVGQLVASKVIHKAFVEVNEEGTEAAAATGFRVICYDLEPCTRFLVDRPFMFLIRSQDPDVVLFMGSVRQL